MIKVSILIPVYNAELYLRDCIDSVINQSLDNIEVIIIDDGSTDASPQILDEYAQRYAFIQVIHQQNMGVVKTRCNLMALAHGEYVAWIDSDDFMEPMMLKKMYEEGKAAEADLVLCDYNYFPAAVKTKEKWYKPYRGIVDWNFIERNTQQWNKLVKRSLLQSSNIEEWMEIAGEGAYAFVLINAKKIVSIDEKLYNYRVGHTSLSNNKANIELYKKDIRKTENQLQAAKAFKYSDEWLEYFKYRCIYSWIKLMLVAALNGERSTYEDCRKNLNAADWRNNRFTKLVLKNNFGWLKAFVLLYCIPINYGIAHKITKVSM